MAGTVGGDPARLLDFSQDMRPLVGHARESVEHYRQAVAIYAVAGPNDLGRPLPDRGPQAHAHCDRLDRLAEVVGDFARGLAQLEAMGAGPGPRIGGVPPLPGGPFGLPGRPDAAALHRLDLIHDQRLAGSPTPLLDLLRTADERLNWLTGQAWFVVPWTVTGLVRLPFSSRAMWLAPHIRRLAELYETQVLAFRHAPEPVRLAQWLRWQEEASRRIGLQRALAGLPDDAPHRGWGLDTRSGVAPRVPPWLRSVGRIGGRALIPVGAALDIHALTSPSSSWADRGFAASGLTAMGIGGLAVLGVISSPVLIGVGIVAGIASVGYGIYKLWEEYGEAITEWLGNAWKWTTDKLGAGWNWATDQVSSGWNWATDQVGSGWNWATDQVGSGWNWATDQASSGWNWTTDTVSSGVSTATDAIGSALSAGTDTAEAALSSVGDAVNTATDSIGDALSGVGDTASGWFGSAREAVGI
jgi:Flp pilus assembly pilin Flp